MQGADGVLRSGLEYSIYWNGQIGITEQDAKNWATVTQNLMSQIIDEFKFAVDAGACTIKARYGAPIAPFTSIPADVFRRFRITKWGSGVPGGGHAEADDGSHLYAIYVTGPAPEAEMKSAEDGLPAGQSLLKKSVQPTGIKPRRADLAKDDERFRDGIKTLKAYMRRLRKEELPKGIDPRAKMLLAKFPDLEKRVGGFQVMRQILGRRHPRTMKLQISLAFLDQYDD
jgi:hypothetical protein